MTETIAAIIWGLGILLWGAIRFPRRRVAQKTKVIADRKSTFEWIALTACIIGLVVLPLLYIVTGAPGFSDRSFAAWNGWFGLVVMVAFLITFRMSHKHLGKSWSVTLEVREDHKLVTQGIYRYVRHPMYSSFWLWGIAQALLVPNWIAGFAGLASVALLYFGRVAAEEEMMRDEFGEDYVAYCARTGRIIPRLF